MKLEKLKLEKLITSILVSLFLVYLLLSIIDENKFCEKFVIITIVFLMFI